MQYHAVQWTIKQLRVAVTLFYDVHVKMLFHTLYLEQVRCLQWNELTAGMFFGASDV
jgi:hypothetical protein